MNSNFILIVVLSFGAFGICHDSIVCGIFIGYFIANTLAQDGSCKTNAQCSNGNCCSKWGFCGNFVCLDFM